VRRPSGIIGLATAFSIWLAAPLALGQSGRAAEPDPSSALSAAQTSSRFLAQEFPAAPALSFAFNGPADSDRLADQTDDVEIMLDEPTADTADQFIFLNDPEDAGKKKSTLKVARSQDSKPSILFNIKPLVFGTGQTLPAEAGAADLMSGSLLSGSIITGNRITFSYGSVSADTSRNTLDISLGSSFLITPDSIFSPLYEGSGYDILNRQVYNLSLDVAYAGFSIGASFSREKSLSDLNLHGFDVGLGYSGRSWFTDIRFAQYRRDRELLFSANANEYNEYMAQQYFNNIYALEVGAGYSLRPNIRFTGRFTYYTYGQSDEQDPLSDTQIFLLGTNVNF